MTDWTTVLVGPFLVAALLGVGVATAVWLDAVIGERATTGGARATTGAGSAPLAELARLLVQRRRTTVGPDALLWRLGGGGLLTVALLMAAITPLGGHVLAALPVGVVWFNALDVTLWVVVWMAGWGADSVWSMVGGYRYLAQALAYELTLMFALTAPALAAGSLAVPDVVAAQSGGGWHGGWFVVTMPVALLLYLVCVIGFSAWGPLSHPVGADIAGGVLTEPAGTDRLLLVAGRWALLVAGTAFAVPLFLGGGAGPLLPPVAWSLLKMLALLAVVVPVRRRLPVLRADRLMELGWMVGLPLALLQLLVVAVLVVGRG